jgi:hypothetical protein
MVEMKYINRKGLEKNIIRRTTLNDPEISRGGATLSQTEFEILTDVVIAGGD